MKPTPEVQRLVSLLNMWREAVTEGGVPRYTVTPGAGLNTLVTWTDKELRKYGSRMIAETFDAPGES